MVQEASAMYSEAVELMEDDGKESMALDIFRQAIGRLFSHMFPQFCGSFLFLGGFICFCSSFIICFLISHFHMQPSIRASLQSSIHPSVMHPSMQSFSSYIQTCNNLTDPPSCFCQAATSSQRYVCMRGMSIRCMQAATSSRHCM